MQRLADYFLVVGYDHDEERGGRSCGKIIQRFPDKDWPDCPFNPRIIHFCQPQGWILTAKHELPTFFISILTDLDGLRHYCACLTFHQTLLPTTNNLLTKTNSWSDEADDTTFLLPKTQMYAPKCLVLTSKLDCFEAFRNCLGIVYTMYVEPSADIRIETLVGNILGSINVPPPGGHALRFSIGADDRQVIQPPASPTVPCTGLSVYNLFKELGIDHVVTIFCGALSDIKMLFFSKSYWKLTEACKAVESLLFPLKYCYTFIPVLPFDLIEVLDAPTPFIIGVHSDQKIQALANFDGLWIDLDGASVHLTENVKLAPMPEKPYNRVLSSLFQILKPDIHAADLAFPLNGRMNLKTDSSSQIVADYPKYKDESNKDKQIRAIFIRLFSELFAGYRSCLLIIRINPKPVISFHKASFLGHHRLVNNEFLSRVLDSMSFHKFIEERGPPFRTCDIFDDVYAFIYEQLKRENNSYSTAVFEHIKELANQLLLNENPSPQQTYTQKVPQPTQTSCIRNDLPEFPHLDKELINATIKEGIKKQQNSRPYSARVSQPCIVKLGTPIDVLNGRTDISQSARRLEVLKQCIGYIFSDKIAEAKKTSGAVFYSIKSHEDARIALCTELASYKKQNKPRLNNQQFEMIANLLNCALEASSSIDEHGIAYMMLTLATTFHRKLSEEATQFIYTEIQRHAVWANMQFWEMSFYSDVQLQIRNLYLSHEDSNSSNVEISTTDSLSVSSTDTIIHQGSTTTTTNESSIDNCSHQNGIIIHEKTALEIAAEQMRLYSQKTSEEQHKIEELEEQTLYALAIHYIQLMVYMKLPLDISSSTNIRHSIYNHVSHMISGDGDSVTSDFYHSSNDPFNIRDADETSTVGSHDSGNGFDLNNNDDQVTDLVLSFVRKFVDKICDESGVNTTHKNSLHTKLYQTVQVQIEVLEKVYRETRRVAPMPKPLLPRFVTIPELFEHEESIALRSYLLPDGRDEFYIGQNCLLPAEGALIMTNYRLIFKGRPVNPTIANDYLIVRSFPISSLIREKKLSGQFRLDNSNICLHNGIQLRSATFQLIKVFFDDEVLMDDIEKFRTKLVEKRYPESVFQTFCFSIYSDYHPVINKQKDGTLKKYGRYARNVLRKKGLIPPKDLTTHQNISLKLNSTNLPGGLKTLNGSTRHQQNLLIRTPEPVRRSLTLANTRSPKSLSLNNNDRLITGISNITTPSTIHECDEGIVGNNSDDEDEDRLSSVIDESNNYGTISNETKSLERFTDSFVYKDFIRQGLIVTTFSSSRSSIRTTTVTSLSSTISLSISSNINENNLNSNGQQLINSTNINNINNTMNITSGGMNTMSPMNTLSTTTDDSFRISHINRNFGFCRSYPLVLVLPKDIIDESLKKVARCHKLQRVPVIVWRNPRTKSLLLRGSAFCNKGFINLLVKGPQTNTSSSSDTNASMEQERYFDAIVKLTPTKMPFSSDIGDNDEPESIDITPLSVRKTTHHSATNRLQNLLPTRVLYDRPRTKKSNDNSSNIRLINKLFKSSSSATLTDNMRLTIANINIDTLPRSETASYTSMNSPTPSSITTNGGGGNGSTNFDIDFNETILQVHKRSPLYIIGDRAQHRTGRLEQFQNYCFLPLEFHDISQIKGSFKKLTRACVPSLLNNHTNNNNGTDNSSITSINSTSFYKLIEESRWIYQLQKILMISVYIVQFSEDHASSVMICVEDGWDTAAQLVSISELLLDPYYRTFEGFQTLIEREWFAFGHRFSHRSNQTITNKTGFAPVFLQFLDLVHQIWNQFPTEFEFNEYYLRFLAYHHLSNRFKNFMLDCDCERKKDRNWYVDTTRDSLTDDITGLYRCNTINIWDYITKINRECSRFYNFLYSPSNDSCVLRPSYKMYSLDIWDFYLSETLETGCPYDLDIALAEHDEHLNDVELRQRNKCISAIYDDISICLPDFFNEIVSEMSNTLLHTNGESWKTYWDKIEKPEREKAQRLSMQDESYKRMNSQQNYLQPQRSLSSSISSSRTSSIYGSHTYESVQFSTPQICDICDELIDSKRLSNEGIRALQCRDCSNVCHEKCRTVASCKPCRRMGISGSSDSQIVVNSTRFETGSVTDITDVLLEKAGVYDHHGLSHPYSSSNVSGNNSGPQHRTHEGYLRKRGHLLKQWKERWFVLDSVRHELRYYDSSDDQTAKGVILLADAVEILPYTGPFPNALRRFDSRAAFELHTNRRIYNFIAATAQDAQTWTEKIKSCLLDS